ncbi:MAG: hypothetical protein AAF915_22135 [Cyanobacteria bacterium P01_D01_bin.50]
MEYLAENEEITNRKGREITGIESSDTMKNIFYRLKNKGLIELIPGRLRIHSAWRKIK